MHWDKTCSKEKSRVFCIFTDFKVIQGCFTPLNNMHQQDFQTQFFGFYFDWINLWEFETIWRSMNLLLIGSSSIGFGFQGRFSLVFKVREEGKHMQILGIDSWGCSEYEVMYGCPVAHLTGFWFSNIFGYFALLFCFSCKSFNDLLPRFWHPPRPVQSLASTSL